MPSSCQGTCPATRQTKIKTHVNIWFWNWIRIFLRDISHVPYLNDNTWRLREVPQRKSKEAHESSFCLVCFWTACAEDTATCTHRLGSERHKRISDVLCVCVCGRCAHLQTQERSPPVPCGPQSITSKYAGRSVELAKIKGEVQAGITQILKVAYLTPL